MVKPTLFKTQNTILSAAMVLAVASGVGAFLGFIKNRVLTSYFGVSTDLALFYTADRIPNLIYSVLVVGALSTIFIPIFTQEHKKDPEKAWKTASSMINSSLLFFFILGTIIFIFSNPIMQMLSVGKFSAAEIVTGSNLMRIMLLAQLVLIISSFVTCILQSFKYFLIPALSPIVYSLGMIIGTIIFAPTYGIYAPAIGLIIGALLHFMVQLPVLLNTDFSFSFKLNLKDKDLRNIFTLMPPRIMSVLIANTISTVNNSFAILISAPSVVYLKFANQLQFFPVNFVGISIASAILPTLSAQIDDTAFVQFKKTFVTSLHQMLFLVVPASVILFVLRIPVVRLVYGVSNFPWEATVKTSYALAFFSISIFAQSSVYLITRAFYALKDTKTPLIVSAVTIVINVVLSLLFIEVFHFGVWSVALSYSITSIIDAVTMLFLLSKKLGGFELETIVVPFTKISFAALLMGISLYAPLKLLDQYVFDTTKTINLLALTAIAGTLGTAVYLLFTKLFKVGEIQMFYKLLRRLNLGSQKDIPSDATPEAQV